MKRDLEKALDNVDITYRELVEIANNYTTPQFKAVNSLVEEIKSKIESLTPDELSNYQMRLSILSFRLSEVKDKSSLMAECAETLRKEKYSENFNKIDGSVALKESKATLDSSEEILVELVYNMISSAFKTKVDEIHRLVDSLKTSLIYKVQEIKIMNQTDSQL